MSLQRKIILQYPVDFTCCVKIFSAKWQIVQTLICSNIDLLKQLCQDTLGYYG